MDPLGRIGMLTYDDLARACRENDLIAEQRGLKAAVESVGAGLVSAMQVAEQRAIRAALFASGRTMPQDMTTVDIRPMEQAEFTRLMSATLDGIAIGLRAALNRDNP
jgi:hypothetical protein